MSDRRLSVDEAMAELAHFAPNLRVREVGRVMAMCASEKAAAQVAVNSYMLEHFPSRRGARAEWVRIFRRFNGFISDCGEDIDGPLTVFRGVLDRSWWRGLSWSLNPNAAIAAVQARMRDLAGAEIERGPRGRSGHLCVGEVDVDDVFVHATSHGFDEIVCDPRRVRLRSVQPVTLKTSCSLRASWNVIDLQVGRVSA